MTRLAVVFNNHAPYFQARLQAAGRLLPLTAMPLHDPLGLWRGCARSAAVPAACSFQVQPLLKDEGGPLKEGQPLLQRPLRPGLILAAVHRALDELHPDVVAVHGWSRRCALAALAWCARRNVPAVMLGDFQAVNRPRETLGDAVKRRLLKRCSAVLTAGRPHVECLRRWGVSEDRIRTGFDVVDNAHFAAGAAAARDAQEATRARLGLPDSYFLCVSRLSPEKNLFNLLASFAAYRAEAGDAAWKLVIAGDGPLYADLTLAIGRWKLGGHVLLAGTYEYPEMPAAYGLARALILASTIEPWGLCVNEALAAGRPVFLSERCSCARDLVREGTNGHVFDPHAPERLTAHLLKASRGVYDLAAMGQAGRDLIAEWTPEHFATRLRGLVDLAHMSPLRLTRADGLLASLLARRPGAPA